MIILHDNEDGWLGIDYEEADGIFVLYSGIRTKWSLSKYKKYLILFGEIINKLKVDELYSFAFDEKSKKFNELFGFQDVGHGLTEDYVPFRLMKLEIR